MKVDNVLVEFSRKRDGFLKARVRQWAADGYVYGQNMLHGKQITYSETAKTEVLMQLQDKVDRIEFREV